MALRALAALLVGLLVGLAIASRQSRSDAVQVYSAKHSPCGPDVGVWARELGTQRVRDLTLCLLNQRRARNGLPALNPEPRLELAAQRYVDDMVKRQFFAHVDLGGLDPQDRILMAGYPSINAYTGENLAWGTGYESSPVEIVDGWMHSPGHRENILRPAFREIGIGVAFDVPEHSDAPDPGATYATSFGGPPIPDY